ncbi:hypothetical protein PIROE2DRAFT_4297 [Piromyces sp. E2]|nr:hypothetical protein PIROE2DRAFT_4297 [Piromyces sp. E2]|eukprot:OUM68147.1 hypothetical protein PIROE2DRAFT_4297 [Piromyces sp. E2]
MSKCTYCQLENTIVFDDNIGYVCSKCGTLLDESLNQLSLIDTELPYKEDNDFGFYVKSGENLVTSLIGSVGSDSKTYYLRRKKKELYEIIDKILDQLNLLQYRQFSRDWFNRCISHPEIKKKGLSQKGQIIAACAVIITIREFQIPINFKEISEIVHTDLKHLGQYYLEVTKCMNIQPKENNNTTELFLPKIIDIFIKKMVPSVEIVNIDQEKQKNTFYKEAMVITQMCKDLGLQEGRNRIPLAAAIVQIIMEGYIKRLLTKKEQQQLANILNQSLNTIEKRYKEVANVLIECAKCIGLFSQVRVKSLPKYYSSIMSYSDDFDYFMKQTSLYTHKKEIINNEFQSSSSTNSSNIDHQNFPSQNNNHKNSLEEKESSNNKLNISNFNSFDGDQPNGNNDKLPSLSSLIIQMPPSSAKNYLRQLKRKKKLEQVKIITNKLKKGFLVKTIQNHQVIPMNSYYLYYIIEFILFLKEVQQKYKLALITKLKQKKDKHNQLMHIKKENSEDIKLNNTSTALTITEQQNSTNQNISKHEIKKKSVLSNKTFDSVNNNKRKLDAIESSGSEPHPLKKNRQGAKDNLNLSNNNNNNKDFIYFTIPTIKIVTNEKEKSEEMSKGIYFIIASPFHLITSVEHINWSLYNILILYLTGLFTDQEIIEMNLKRQQMILGKLKEVVITQLKKDMKSKEVISKIQVMTLLSKPFIFKTAEKESLEFSKSVITIESNSGAMEDEVEDEDIISDQELNSYILKKGSKELAQRQQLLSLD